LAAIGKKERRGARAPISYIERPRTNFHRPDENKPAHRECIRTLMVAVLAVAGFAFTSFGMKPAEAACQLVTATHSAPSKAEAAQSSRALAVQSAYQLKRARGWSYVSMSARRVKGDPFWKAVRPNGVPADAQLKPDLVTSRFYTTCFSGVVVPYVCTTGSTVCGN
jgi:hypothetical protein